MQTKSGRGTSFVVVGCCNDRQQGRGSRQSQQWQRRRFVIWCVAVAIALAAAVCCCLRGRMLTLGHVFRLVVQRSDFDDPEARRRFVDKHLIVQEWGEWRGARAGANQDNMADGEAVNAVEKDVPPSDSLKRHYQQ